MKKLYILFAAVALSILTANAALDLSETYTVNFTSESAPIDGPSDDVWTKKNAGSYGSPVWSLFGGNALRIWNTSTTNNIDAWLISPAINATVGNQYKVTFTYKIHGASTKFDNLAVYFTATAPNSTAEGALEAAKNSPSVTIEERPTAYTELEATFEATESGTAYIAFRCYGTVNQGPYIQSVTIEEIAGEGGSGGPGTEEPEEPEEPEDHDCVADITSLPYISTIGVSDGVFDEGWSMCNANEDDRTWSAKADGAYFYRSYQVCDDYLISPLIHIDKNSTLAFKYNMSDSYDVMTLYACSAFEGEFSPEVMTEAQEIKKLANTNNDEYVFILPDLSALKTGDYHFVFHVTSQAFGGTIVVKDFTIAETGSSYPGAVSNLTATATPERALELTLNWELPTTDILGASLSGKNFEKIEIYRDGTETENIIATLSGTATSFVDNATTGLESGFHTYGVVVTVEGAASAMAKVGPTAYVGPLEPFNLPVTFPITTQDEFDLFTAIKGENSTISGTIQKWNFRADSNSAHIFCPDGGTEDDYLFTPPLNVIEEGDYRVTFMAGIDEPGKSGKLEGYIGQSYDLETLTFCSDDFVLTKPMEENSFEFSVTETGTYYVALRACYENRGEDQRQHYYLTSISIEKLETETTGVESVAGKNGVKYTRGTLSFAGTASVAVYDLTGALVAGEPAANGTYELSALNNGVYIIRIVSANGEAYTIKVVK
ncbi:MAG: T9SS type A sorting domain-containing protein [Muribaculaceae bacterium]|nr:T9SS type A sorting domain-containing protein [Muribaculaceae bacterium]